MVKQEVTKDTILYKTPRRCCTKKRLVPPPVASILASVEHNMHSLDLRNELFLTMRRW